jgi:hypothetical protein
MISMAPAEVTRRLVEASDASDLTTDRLETKLDMSPAGVTARLREASELYAACVALRASRRSVAP